MVTKRVYYTSRKYVSGETPSIKIYNPSGTLVANTTMAELGTEGIYYYDYTTLCNGNHIAYMYEENNVDFQTIEIGFSSTQRVYFTSRKIQTELTDVKLTVYNPAGALILDDVIMTELANGIYYYDVHVTSKGVYGLKMSSEINDKVMCGSINYVTTCDGSAKLTDDDYLIVGDESNELYIEGD